MTDSSPMSNLLSFSKISPRRSAEVQLTIGIEEDVLLVSLIGEQSLHLVGEVDQADERLARLESQWHSFQVRTTDDPQFENNPKLLGFGAELFRELLPRRIKKFFSETSHCKLQLKIHESLALIPWEFIFDGANYWFSKHQISRSILGGAKFDKSAKPLKLITGGPRILLLDADPAQLVVSGFINELAIQLSRNTKLDISKTSWSQLTSETFPKESNVFNIVHVVGNQSQCFAELHAKPPLAKLIDSAQLIVLHPWPNQLQPKPTWAEMGRQLRPALALKTPICVALKASDGEQTPIDFEHFHQSLIGGKSISQSVTLHNQRAHLSGNALVFFGTFEDTLLSDTLVQTSHRSFRQVTSLSYDLVGSTELMQTLGIEQYSQALLNCHSRFAEIVKEWGGISDQPQGDDGIMCYFGSLAAKEDSPRSAIFAALAMIEESKALGLKIRIGLATGQVAINGDQVVGLTVHLAARLQALAASSEILVSESTAELVKLHFALLPFSQGQDIKGFQHTAPIFKVTGTKRLNEHSSVAGTSITPMFGRKTELATLTQAWSNVQAGRSIWIQITGEAGIGKSHLVSNFRDLIRQQRLGELTICRCFPETKNRAYAPLIELSERWFRVQSTDDESARNSKILLGINKYALNQDNKKALAFLLGLPHQSKQDPLHTLPLEPRRRFLSRTLSSWLIAKSKSRPICFVLEDVQWADPSTIEFLHKLKTEIENYPILILLTERTETHSERKHELSDETIKLSGLDTPAVRAMIAHLAAKSELSQATERSIEAKSDGVPLFIEMSTRMVIENPSTAKTLSINQSTGNFPIPITVRDLLGQRLDSLGAARSLVQLCSIIGREFSHQLLLALSDLKVDGFSAKSLEIQLDLLVGNGLLVSTGTHAEMNLRYQFRHALIQEAAYQSMWESDRKSLHYAIAQTVESKLSSTAAAQPEVLARHYQACGASQEASNWHWLAARKFKTQEAHAESMYHLAAAKSMLANLPSSPKRIKSELDIELTLAGQLIATKGYGSDNAGQSYLVALSLAQSISDNKSLLRAQLGLEAYYLMRADFGKAHAYLTLAQHTAKEFNDALTQAQCLFALANVLHHQGHAHAMQDLCNQCLKVCRENLLHNKLVQSPEVMSLMYSAVGLWEMGFVDTSLTRAREGVQVAERLGQRLGLGQALGMQAMVLLWSGYLTEAESISARAVTVCQAGDHDMWTAHARFIHGRCISELGELQRGLDLMDSAYELWTATGTIVTRTFYLALRADTNGSLGNIDKGLALIDEALELIRTHGERYYEPEALRIKGELLVRKSDGNDQALLNDAEKTLLAAQSCAEQLAYYSLGLRCAISLASLYITRESKDKAIEILNAALNRLQEGGQSRDQQTAKNMLKSIAY
jgi:class 3 adenylate cyclase/tetratricopeptide (TPR) repeat protein